MFAATKENNTENGQGSNNLKDSAQRFKDDARNTASAVKDDIEGVARRSGEHVRELADSASHSLSDARETVMVHVRENPLQSSLVALGVGLVVGMLFARR